MPIYIIEHLEPRMWKWCLIEYRHISKIVGKKNLWITNVNNGSDRLKNIGNVIKKSVSELRLKNVCVLDPEAKKTLTPNEAKKFDYFVFGGILGDYPPRKRTKKELTSRLKGAVARNIGKKQMSTDNAVYVVSRIVKGKKLNDMKFVNKLIIRINENEETVLPYRYVVVNGKALVGVELVRYLKKKKGF